MKGDRLQLGIMQRNQNIVDPFCITGGHKHSVRQVFPLSRAEGQHIKAGFVRVRNLDILSKHLQPVQGRGTGGGNGGKGFVLLIGNKACRSRGAGHLARLGIRQVFLPPPGALGKPLGMRADRCDILDPRTRHRHQGLADGQNDLADDRYVFGCNQRIEIAGDRAAQSILLRDNRILGLPRQHICNRVVHGLFRKKLLAAAEPELRSFLGIRPGRPQKADLHRLRILRRSGQHGQAEKQHQGHAPGNHPSYHMSLLLAEYSENAIACTYCLTNV